MAGFRVRWGRAVTAGQIEAETVEYMRKNVAAAKFPPSYYLARFKPEVKTRTPCGVFPVHHRLKYWACRVDLRVHRAGAAVDGAADRLVLRGRARWEGGRWPVEAWRLWGGHLRPLHVPRGRCAAHPRRGRIGACPQLQWCAGAMLRAAAMPRAADARQFLAAADRPSAIANFRQPIW